VICARVLQGLIALPTAVSTDDECKAGFSFYADAIVGVRV